MESQDEAACKLVVKSHTVCRGPDGKIKWEADTVPVEVRMGTHTVLGVQPKFSISTSDIHTGREHF